MPINDAPSGLMEKASLLATVGSTAHGISVSQAGPEGDDLDLLGMYVPSRSGAYGLREAKPLVWRSKPEGVKSEAGDVDLTLHPARKFIMLAAKGNPTILAALFSPEQHIADNEALGLLLNARDARLFHTISAGRAFIGYAEAQHQRLLGLRGQMKVKRPELVDAHGYDTKYAAHVLRLCHQGEHFMVTGLMPMPVMPSAREVILDVRRGALSLDQVVETISEMRARLALAVSEAEGNGVPQNAPDALVDQLILDTHAAAWADGDH